jgi:hypothetical protein
MFVRILQNITCTELEHVMKVYYDTSIQLRDARVSGAGVAPCVRHLVTTDCLYWHNGHTECRRNSPKHKMCGYKDNA